MKQILQNLGDGTTILAEVPCPRRGSGAVLCQTTRSLVSLGTEKMLIDFGKSGWLAKARSQPDKVKQVLQKIKTDGLWTTLDAVKAKLDTPIPLGYCHVGSVIEADPGSGFTTGDRVISNGPHAEIVSVPENLVAKIPDNVTDETAAFAVVAAIGLQGIRLAQPTLGERFVVSGLGLIGLLAVQILRAHGCHVLGIDFDSRKLELARHFGAQTVDLSAGQDPIRVADEWTQGQGIDAVLITASTKSDELVHQAATMCRKRGRIVLVGVIGLNLQRADFYEKELSFQVSCSYGPGRYENNYEKKGLDYPIGFIRWTEQRNFLAVLDLMADGRIDTRPLITHRFSFDNALDGYKAISEPGAMGILLEYDSGEAAQAKQIARTIHIGPSDRGQTKDRERIQSLNSAPHRASPPHPASPLRRGEEGLVNSSGSGPKTETGISFIGAGGFTTRMLLPLLPTQGIVRKSIVSSSGVSAAYAGRKFGFQTIGSDSNTVLSDPDVDAVFITTPHNTHARIVCDALNADKHVFVEKPLAMNYEELAEVEQVMQSHQNLCLMVGFNRRFSPHSVALQKWLAGCPGPRSILITVNAGTVPPNHWTQDPGIGGGRIIGEGCHFIDLARFFAASPITTVNAVPMGGGDGRLGDCVTIQLAFESGSIATVHYLANGSKDFPKERIEIFAGGKVLVCDNFRCSREIGGKRRLKSRSQDKGHAAELKAFLQCISNGGAWPIADHELLEVSRATIDAATQVQQRLPELA